MAEAPGAQVGPYRIVGPIGSGGFATVYRAVDERFESDVAIKVLAENHSLDADIRERFLSEARLLRRLSNPHLITVFDVGETDRRQPYLVMELASSSLLDRKTDEVKISVDDVRSVVGAVSNALAALHAKRVVHRDVSPQNLLVVGQAGDRGDGQLLGENERLVLADLGFAKDLARNSGITVGGGTAGFSAPDQRSAGVGVADARDDVYAASAVVMWLTAGLIPSKTDRPRVDMIKLGVAKPLAIELDRGVADSRDARHHDIDAWRTSVLAAIEQSAPPEPSTPPEASESTAPGKRRWAIAAAALASAGLAAGATVVLTQDPDPAGVVVTDQGDGTESVEVTAGDVAVAIFGPSQTTLGESATFEAGIDGGERFFWITPSGEVVADQQILVLDEVDSGRAVITLVVVRSGAPPVTSSFEINPTPR